MGKGKGQDNKPTLSQTIKAAGPVISQKELKQIQNQYGDKGVDRAKSYAVKTEGVSFNQSAQNFYQNYKQSINTSTNNTQPPVDPLDKFTEALNNFTSNLGGGSSAGGGGYIPYSEYSLYPDVLSNQAKVEAERVRTQGLLEAERVRSDALLQAERIRDAGSTERLKYEVDNKIPQIQEESKGKVDLQKVINAGYKNIQNIKRGSEMVASITSMFNF